MHVCICVKCDSFVEGTDGRYEIKEENDKQRLVFRLDTGLGDDLTHGEWKRRKKQNRDKTKKLGKRQTSCSHLRSCRSDVLP